MKYVGLDEVLTQFYTSSLSVNIDSTTRLSWQSGIAVGQKCLHAFLKLFFSQTNTINQALLLTPVSEKLWSSED